MACFVAPGEVACIWTEDPENPFYQAAQDAFRTLSQATDAKGRRLTVHKLCLTKKPCCLEGAETSDAVEGTVPRENGEVSIASYMNFLIVNGAVIAPQYGDENDQLAIQQLQQMFPDRQIVGVQTREVAFGGGNIHCITQQQPKACAWGRKYFCQPPAPPKNDSFCFAARGRQTLRGFFDKKNPGSALALPGFYVTFLAIRPDGTIR